MKTPTQILQNHKGDLANTLSLLKAREAEAVKALDALRIDIAEYEAMFQNYADAVNSLKK